MNKIILKPILTNFLITRGTYWKEENGDVYLLSSVGGYQVALTSLSNGDMWSTRPISVGDIDDISLPEWEAITVGGDFERVISPFTVVPN